ncbi:hypothetical protein AAG747_01595 [Rapidithrix thailandica]|uniref:Uncharacterized protein n=1 Tax=Rapidithrix thailandica TaxID=413964 RepID=A0AAW9RU48_9BACT
MNKKLLAFILIASMFAFVIYHVQAHSTENIDIESQAADKDIKITQSKFP